MIIDKDRQKYHALQERLAHLHNAPVRDWSAIDEVMVQLEAEQLKLKSADGQHGNNPIEAQQGDPCKK